MIENINNEIMREVYEDACKEVYQEELKRRIEHIELIKKISNMSKSDIIDYLNNKEENLIEDFHFYVNKEILEDFDIQLLIYKNNNRIDIFDKNKIFENKKLILKIVRKTIFQNNFNYIIKNFNGKLNNEKFLLELCRNYKGNKQYDYIFFNLLEQNFDTQYVNYLKQFSYKFKFDEEFYLKITDCIKYTKKFINYNNLKNKISDKIEEKEVKVVKKINKI